MPDRDPHARRPAPRAGEPTQPALDAASGDPRTGPEPGDPAGAGPRPDARGDAHPAPRGTPNEDNTDDRA